MLEEYVKQSFWIVFISSGIPLLCASACGLFTAVVQAATQIQEQTITYLLRFLAIVCSLTLLGEWLSTELVQFFQEVLGTISIAGTL